MIKKVMCEGGLDGYGIDSVFFVFFFLVSWTGCLVCELRVITYKKDERKKRREIYK